jgi:hypothetical protein
MRYLTVIDYSQVPDSNYRQVHVMTMDPAIIRLLWLTLTGAIYALFLLLSTLRRRRDGWLDHGLAFCFLVLLQPFTQKYALVALLWPAVAAGTVELRRTRLFLCAATVLVLIQPLVPGAAAQRLLQVIGFDFGASLLLTAGLTAASLNLSDDSRFIYKTETDLGEATRTI